MTKAEIVPGRMPDDVPGPWGRSVTYDAARDQVRLVLESGATVVIPRGAIAELRDVPVSQLNDLELVADGEALSSRANDVDIFLPGLLWDVIGFKAPVACWSGDSPAGTGRATPRRPA